jgi:biopolymer transport protein ExbD
MKKKRVGNDEEAGVDMTPMLDIVFIMLIFFIVTTTFVNEKGLSVKRPEPNQNQSKSNKKNVSVRIDELGTINLNGRITDVERVTANVQNFLSENITDAAVVQAHPKTKHGLVVQVMDKISEAGISNLSVLVKE